MKARYRSGISQPPTSPSRRTPSSPRSTVASRATIYKKLKFVTNENLGWGKIHLPELELQTTAYWASLDGAAAGWRRADLDVALAGTGRALQTVASVLLMVDPRDLGLVAQVRSPHA